MATNEEGWMDRESQPYKEKPIEEILADPAFQPLKQSWKFPGLAVGGNYPWVYERVFGFNPKTALPVFQGMKLEPEGKGRDVPVLVLFGTEEDGLALKAKPNFIGCDPHFGDLYGYRFLPVERKTS